MTPTRTGSGLALLVGAAVLVAACGSSGPSATATQSATQPPEPPASFALPSLDIPGFSFALPSFSSDADLEAKFPDSIGGEALNVQSMSGADFMNLPGGTTASKDIETALQQLGKTPADLSVGFGGNNSITIFAFRIKGVPADQFLGKYLGATSVGSTVTDASIGGKTVKKVVTDGQVSAYLYLSGDILWTVGGNNPTDALLNEAFSKLP